MHVCFFRQTKRRQTFPASPGPLRPAPAAVDPFTPYGNKLCRADVSVASLGGSASASANVTFLVRPHPWDWQTGP
jgi:hypothetical protein